MKKILSLIFVMILSLSASCLAEEESYAGTELRGKHELLPIDSLNNTLDILTASTNKYVLMLANSDVVFLWIGNKRKVYMTSLSINKVRFAYEDVNVPYIVFKWSPTYGIRDGDMVKIMSESLIYAIIYCKEERLNIKTKLEKE